MKTEIKATTNYADPRHKRPTWADQTEPASDLQANSDAGSAGGFKETKENHNLKLNEK